MSQDTGAEAPTAGVEPTLEERFAATLQQHQFALMGLSGAVMELKGQMEYLLSLVEEPSGEGH